MYVFKKRFFCFLLFIEAILGGLLDAYSVSSRQFSQSFLHVPYGCDYEICEAALALYDNPSSSICSYN